MNLLDRIRALQLVLIATGLFFSCNSEEEPFDFGLENNTSVEFVELVLPSRSIFIDSLRTDNESTILAGTYRDNRFGQIEAEGYTQINYTSGDLVSDTLQYDSLVVHLTVDNYASNNDDLSVNLDLFTIDQDIESSVVYLKQNNGSPRTFVDSLSFTLSDTSEVMNQNVRIKADHLGSFLFRRLTQDSISSYGHLLDVVFRSSELNSSIVTFNVLSDSSEIFLYTSYDTTVYESRLTFQTQHYTHISNDLSGSEISNINDREVFDLSSNEQFISPIFGIYNYVDLTPLKDFVQNNDNILINSAEISTPLLSFAKQKVSGLRYYFYKDDIGIKGEGIFSDGANTAVLSSTAYRDQSFNVLAIGTLNEEEATYTSDLTFFTEFYYYYFAGEQQFLVDGLVLTPNAFVTLQEIELNNPSTTVKLYYTSIE
jgi:hypothetical protein